MNKILITGKNSFIGTYFKDNSSEFQVSEADVKNKDISEISFEGYDTVFHVAAIVHQDKSIPDDIYYQVNRDLAVSVAQKAKDQGVKQLVFMSTVKVYGENSSEEAPWTESSECYPQDAYGKSKLQAEKLLLSMSDSSFVVTIIRTPVVYGVGVKGNIYRLAKLVSRYPLIPLGNINNKRAMVYIGNLLALIQTSIVKRHNGILLAGDNMTFSTSTFVKHLMSATSKKRILIPFPFVLRYAIKWGKPKLYQRLFGSMVCDNTATCERLDFKPPYTEQEGLEELMCHIVKS
ncbi:MAG: NAD-dependent epimerase/dehydratase family protein [Bacteroidales bacterium]|jgi:nucleoside-diphosphate-sugar epimerase|nr:NAD-dependent epimerase/dehydratase family protein [Bacteroidales bacterium]